MKRNNPYSSGNSPGSSSGARTRLDPLAATMNAPRSKFDLEKHEKVQSRNCKLRLIFALSTVAVLSILIWMLQAAEPETTQQMLRNVEHAAHEELLYAEHAVKARFAGRLGHPAHVAELQAQVAALDATVRAIKKTGVIMQTDEKALQATEQLQQATRDLIAAKYGSYDTATSVFRVKVDLEFQPSIPDYTEDSKYQLFWIELAPVAIMPCSVFNFMEIVTTYKSGGFNRNAGHVLQTTMKSNITKSLAFQEYSPDFPHVKGTVGYAGRPSGPPWYVSIKDNSKNHGPGSQQSHNPYEADACFGKVLGGVDDGVIPRVHKMPGDGFLAREKWVIIPRMTLYVPDDGGGGAAAEGKDDDDWSAGYVKWQPIV